MVALAVVDINRKIVFIMRLENRSAVNMARKIYFTPPQRRHIRIVAFNCNDYDYLTEHDMYYWVSKVPITYEQLQEWQTYPIVPIKRKEIKTNG